MNKIGKMTESELVELGLLNHKISALDELKNIDSKFFKDDLELENRINERLKEYDLEKQKTFSRIANARECEYSGEQNLSFNTQTGDIYLID